MAGLFQGPDLKQIPRMLHTDYPAEPAERLTSPHVSRNNSPIRLRVWQTRMCNDYGNRVPYSTYLEAFSHLKVRLFAPGGPPNLEPRDDIWPSDVTPNHPRRQWRRRAHSAALGLSSRKTKR